MRNRNEKGNTMKTQQENTTTWSECQCEACTKPKTVKAETFTCNCYQCATGNKHVGDGPSGYDYFSDTRRWC